MEYSLLRREDADHGGLLSGRVRLNDSRWQVAALAAIRETGDFHGFAHRSARTVNALANLDRDLVGAKRTVSLAETNAVLVATAQVLTEDLASWQSLYSGQRLNLRV